MLNFLMQGFPEEAIVQSGLERDHPTAVHLFASQAKGTSSTKEQRKERRWRIWGIKDGDQWDVKLGR